MTYPTLTKDAFEAMVSYHEKINESCFGRSGPELSDKARNCQRLISSGVFGCNQDAVASLVSIILGEKLPRGNMVNPIKQGALVTAIQASHGIAIGRTYYVGAVNKDGSLRVSDARSDVGASLHSRHCREATSAEIRAFMTERHGGEEQVVTTATDDVDF